MKRTTVRTPFGERLIAARKHAGLTQGELAKAVGMAQSTLAEAEKTANGSAKTAQIAAVTKVNVTWLATGVGPMVDSSYLNTAEDQKTYGAGAPVPLPTKRHLGIGEIIIQLGRALEAIDESDREALAILIKRVVLQPETAVAQSEKIVALLGAQGNPVLQRSSRSHS